MLVLVNESHREVSGAGEVDRRNTSTATFLVEAGFHALARRSRHARLPVPEQALMVKTLTRGAT
jgi:predicted N-acetyltransferase YhbS